MVQKNVYARSTKISRTRASLHGVLHGLYPPETRPSPSYTFNMITRDRQDEPLHSKNGEECPLLDDITQQIYQDEEDQYYSLSDSLFSSIQSLTQYIPRNLASAPDSADVLGMSQFMDQARVLHCHHPTFICSNSACQAELQHAGGVFHQLAMFSTFSTRPRLANRQQQLKIGQLIYEFLHLIISPSSHTPPMNVFLGHDNTLTAVLAALEAKQVSWPAYASSLVLEVWQSQHLDMAVRILNNGKAIQTDYCDFEQGCPLTTLYNVLKPKAISPMDWNKACFSSST